MRTKLIYSNNLIFLCFFSFVLQAQILSGAKFNSIVKSHKTRIDINKHQGYEVTESTEILFLNEDAEQVWTELNDYYHKTISVHGELLDEKGKLLKKIKLDDVGRRGGFSQINFLDDNEILYHQFNHNAYPYTVKYQWKTRVSQSFFFPQWLPLNQYNQLVQYSSFEVFNNSDKSISYLEENLTKPLQVNEIVGGRHYKWEADSLAPIIPDVFFPGFDKISPFVRIKVNTFNIEQFSGRSSSWKEISNFVYQLNLGRDSLSAEIKSKIDQLLNNVNDVPEKVKILYTYLQQNYRYISIQNGLGGWQPFPAQIVCNKGFGDCKGLSNLMYAMLRYAGIQAHYTLVNAGEHAIEPRINFPSTYFNHAIVMVKNEKDTIWLECTSSENPCGYMGAFTEGKLALVIQEKEGQLVKIPVTTDRIANKIKGSLSVDGVFHGCVSSERMGERNILVDAKRNPEQRKDDFLSLFNQAINSDSFNYSIKLETVPMDFRNMEFECDDIIQVTTSRIYMPSLLKLNLPELNHLRNYAIAFKRGKVISDTLEINLPTGYSIESRPPNNHFDLGAVQFDFFCELKENKLICSRKLTFLKGNLENKDFNKYNDLSALIQQLENEKIVLVKE